MTPPHPSAALLLPPPSPPADSTKAPVEHGVSVTALTALGPDIFTNTVPPWHPPGARGIFGGAAVALCLAAAQATVPSPAAAPHSLHCYFLLPGRAGVPIVLHVERVRDGRTFSTRTVQARQEGRCILTMTTSFARLEPGPSAGRRRELRHSHPMSGGLAPPAEAHGSELDEAHAAGAAEAAPFAHAGIEIVPGANGPHEGRTRVWLRARGRISPEGGMAAHLAALAYMSDSNLLGTVMRAHGAVGRIGMAVSLDHSVYFHDPVRVRADEWMLAEMESGWAGAGRGLASQRIYARDGTLLATCVQEGVLRMRDGGDEQAKL